MNKVLQLVICLVLPLGVGIIAGIVTAPAINQWYSMLNKPSFNPPNNLFAPVWTVLYIFMGISFCRITRLPASESRNRAIIIFVVQLVLNFWWSFLFFRFHLIGAAFVDIIAIWISVLLMIILFYRLDRVSGVLQVPYLLWVSFAGALNGAIWMLN